MSTGIMVTVEGLVPYTTTAEGQYQGGRTPETMTPIQPSLIQYVTNPSSPRPSLKSPRQSEGETGSQRRNSIETPKRLSSSKRKSSKKLILRSPPKSPPSSSSRKLLNAPRIPPSSPSLSPSKRASRQASSKSLKDKKSKKKSKRNVLGEDVDENYKNTINDSRDARSPNNLDDSIPELPFMDDLFNSSTRTEPTKSTFFEDSFKQTNGQFAPEIQEIERDISAYDREGGRVMSPGEGILLKTMSLLFKVQGTT
jgi:hypothetical protein